MNEKTCLDCRYYRYAGSCSQWDGLQGGPVIITGITPCEFFKPKRKWYYLWLH